MNKKLPKPLTKSEVDTLLPVVHNPRDRAAICLMLFAGLRVSEVINLKLENILWDEQVLRFVGKGNKESELPISNRLRDELESMLRSRPITATHEYLLWNLKHPDQPIGRRQSINKMLNTYAKKAGIQRVIHPHMLRHTFGSEIARKTSDLGRVQRALRHSKPDTSAGYVHLSPDAQREEFEKLDRRPWLYRKLSALKPHIIPDLLKPKLKPITINETIGRATEISKIRKNVTSGRHTILVGERGVGKRHLLKPLSGDNVFHLESFSPVREKSIELCEQLIQKGLIADIPKGRSADPFLSSLVEVGNQGDKILIIDSLNGLDRKQLDAMRKLASSWTIFSSVEYEYKTKMNDLLFGNYDTIEINPLDKESCYLLTRKLTSDLNIPDEKEYLRHIQKESSGNPQAIIDLVEATRLTGELFPHHSAQNKVLSATPLISLFTFYLIATRYSASAMSEPDLKIWVMLFFMGIMPAIIFDRILRTKNR